MYIRQVNIPLPVTRPALHALLHSRSRLLEHPNRRRQIAPTSVPVDIRAVQMCRLYAQQVSVEKYIYQLTEVSWITRACFMCRDIFYNRVQ